VKFSFWSHFYAIGVDEREYSNFDVDGTSLRILPNFENQLVHGEFLATESFKNFQLNGSHTEKPLAAECQIIIVAGSKFVHVVVLTTSSLYEKLT